MLGQHPEPLLQRAKRVLAAGVVGAAVVSALGLGVHNVATGPSWEVQNIVVTGNRHVSDTAIQHLANLRVGAHLFSAPLDAAIAGVEQHPWVKHAEARRAFPGTVEISVVEYEPVLLLASQGLWYVDSGGVVFREASSNDLDYPVLTGVDDDILSQHPAVARRVITRSLDILSSAQGRPELSPDRISEIHLEPLGGFELILRNGSRLLLGFGDPNDRFDRLERLFASGLNLDAPHRVDLASQHLAIATPIGPETDGA